MATVDDRDIVDAIMSKASYGGLGHYHDDPPVYAIIEYNNAFNGNVAYGLCYSESDRINYLRSEYCKSPREIFNLEDARLDTKGGHHV